jgi:1-deoxy-D-xylulose-5-phosphate reductoisomerase
MQGLLIIGSTGSIGESTLKVVAGHQDRFSIVGLTANSNWQRLVEQAIEFKPIFVHIAEKFHKQTEELLKPYGIDVYCGRSDLIELPARDEVDTLVLAIVGTRGLEPLMSAVRANKRICFANKEPLVTAGEPIMREVRLRGIDFIPIDSEHSAIMQCIVGESASTVEKIFLTASGGPFKDCSHEAFKNASREQALKHPTWTMGAKITIDSATMMNKALEIIEACWLYDLPEDKIEVLIHPQSIIHSMVEFIDHSVKAQLGLPDMRIPIQYALSWPDRLDLAMESPDWSKLSSLTFEQPDLEKFRSLGFARQVFRQGGGYPCVMNAANEAAVESFLADKINFSGIYALVEEQLDLYSGNDHELEELIELDSRIRQAVFDKVN